MVIDATANDGVDAGGFLDPVTERIAAFIRSIGLCIRRAEIAQQTVLPGIFIDHGALLVDEAQLRFAGDLLHEAGHLAVVPPQRHTAMHENTGSDPAEEMMAIAWSYAAALHIGLDPAIVFHDEYKGGGAAILAAFKNGPGFGVPMLEWVGLASRRGPEDPPDLPTFPNMRRWLREDDV
jgi:hypothetical protein